MVRTCFSLLLLICLISESLAQTTDNYYGIVITKVTTDGLSPDTTKLLYCRTISGNLLSVYIVKDGRVSAGITYRINAVKNGLYLYARITRSGELTADSLRIDFRDKEYVVLVNQHDKYILVPDYYKTFKQEIESKHTIMALLGLLSDAIGDYPIADALPLLEFTPEVKKHIKYATIVTRRSQAEISDNWTCTYLYNKKNKLIAVSAADGKLVRFSKKINYGGASVPASINCYLNIEDRQVTERSIKYRNNSALIEWKEHVLETGKNRESDISTTFTRHDLGMLRKIDLSDQNILNLFKPTHNGYIKKHID
ncbi:hypothetical protein [Mucilaginibacter sp.]|uniref:hypothetical protein n=1 Tax=Mucilaginibacter sp. TaxID=1882438 RepID=UPI0035BBD5B4